MIFLAIALGFSFICSILVLFALMRSSQISNAEYHRVERAANAQTKRQEGEKRAPAAVQLSQ